MSETLFTCVNCQLQFSLQIQYKEHYKSEHHRYNVKRKLINLTPLSYPDYVLQFQSEQSSKSQSQSEIYCQVCSKKFMSAQTYKQHINSQKHKNNRKDLIHHSKKDKSQNSSVSEFEVIGGEEDSHKKHCLFCSEAISQKHLKQKHNFPPFKDECTNLEGLIEAVESVVKAGKCIYCQLQFASDDSAKQHMIDIGHCRLDLECFQAYQPFYMWKINESSQEQDDDVELMTEEMDENQVDQSRQSQVITPQTLKSLQLKRQERIHYGISGVTINGKQVGYRSYRKYYKQFLGRKIQSAQRESIKSLPFSEQLKALQCLKPKAEFARLVAPANHR